MSQLETQQCQALTDDGERCAHTVEDGRFCHQHSEDDPIADSATDGGQATGDTEASTDTETSDDEGSDTETSDDEADDAEASNDEAEDTFGGSSAPQIDGAGLVTIRRALQTITPELIGAPMNGVVELTARDDGWLGTVEVIERQSVPDTQDILGRYEVEFDGDGTITGYKRVGRYRRADTDHDASVE